MIDLGRISNPAWMQSGVLLLSDRQRRQTEVSFRHQLPIPCAHPDARPVLRPKQLSLPLEARLQKALKLTYPTDSSGPFLIFLP